VSDGVTLDCVLVRLGLNELQVSQVNLISNSMSY
jgi:hypothetical protein